MVGATIATVIFVGGALVAAPAVYLVLVSILAYGRRHNTTARRADPRVLGR